MRTTLLVSLFLVLASPLLAQESINLDEVTSAPEPEVQAALRGVILQVYGDFDVDLTTPLAFPYQALTFRQNHRSLLVQAASASAVGVNIDALNPSALFEMFLPLDLIGWPKDLHSRLTVGLILIPFGEFDFHHIYGGRQDDTGTFIPKLWSDYGLRLTVSPLPDGVLDLYTVNGFAASVIGPTFKTVGDIDSNLAKAAGLRYRQQIGPGSFVSTSWYGDFYGDTGDPTRLLVMGGLDAGTTFGPLAVKAGGVYTWIWGTGDPYYRYATYGEAKYALTPTLALRLRGGNMDPNSRQNNGSDTSNVNLGLLWRTGPVEWDLVYFYNALTSSPFDTTATENYHEILLKILFTL